MINAYRDKEVVGVFVFSCATSVLVLLLFVVSSAIKIEAQLKEPERTEITQLSPLIPLRSILSRVTVNELEPPNSYLLV
jgi:hypothetical protein